MAHSIVTLTTDFGMTDHYVGVMKGVILNLNPEAAVVDICHDTLPHDVLDGAFAIAQSYQYFPPRTVHLVVVDPGVGTSRRPILASAGKWYFIAPDNGVLSLVFAREEELEVRHITASHYFLESVGHTFHGRDVFAPVAGWLSRNVEPAKFGDPITDFVRFTPPQAKRINERLVKGMVLRVDRFGNLVTNIAPGEVPELFAEPQPPFKIVVGKAEITSLKEVYSQGSPGEVVAIVGSSGYLEISANRGSASQTLGVGRGTDVGIVLG